ncbi:putative ferredoxin/ferredoxin--NADP reductase [Nocardia nova SH22a]|uniref:ferredoxin--NADP(+) reductase n=1 Tax=Nocardia nova SH22a TaxID=1415166 RepID=W5TRP2_9NOCA|nr:FAD-dependent oxidoreductase [Nocardia nova]AHH19881.1 putative ferredoxin/ferredoxin--NADP reductase [Nocardia nova SH22a]
MAHVITQPCCNDAGCVSVCPVDCIRPRPGDPDFGRAELLHIDPATCIDCGACIDECPVDAIVPDGDLTPETEPYQEVNAAYFEGVRDTVPPPAAPPLTVTERGPLRVAIVGSGPSACYAAEDLLSRRDIDVEITMFERLPVPLGLVRYGVAPDHQHTKQVAAAFGRTLNRRQLALELNVEVGTHIGPAELLDHHHAVIYATGASQGRSLGIPGEHLDGVHTATEFVGWYNGHPDHAHRTFDLSGERAVVIGNGNVALDVARILVTDVAALARTDIADHALEALAASRIREVVVVGRRGPEHAAFTTPELLGLGQVRGLDVRCDELGAPDAGMDPVAALKARVARQLAERAAAAGDRGMVFRYFLSPSRFRGVDTVEAVEFARTEWSPAGELRTTADLEEISCGLVFASVGYRGIAVPGLPFRESAGTVPHRDGRVTDIDGTTVPGAYVAGWIKRGPSGVIGTNRYCSQETVYALVEDFAAGRLRTPSRSRADLDELLDRRQPNRLGARGWKSIDAAERGAGRADRRPRVKLVDVAEMLSAGGAGPRGTTAHG